MDRDAMGDLYLTDPETGNTFRDDGTGSIFIVKLVNGTQSLADSIERAQKTAGCVVIEGEE